MRFVFTHSHAFPNGTVIVENDSGADGEGLVEFADGVNLSAQWWRDGEEVILDIPSYRTAKGTVIAAHRWRLARRSDGTWRSNRDT